jgi:hypothetical protein
MTLLFSVITSTSTLWKYRNTCLHLAEKSLGMRGLATIPAFKRNLFSSVLYKNSPELKFLSNVNIYADISLTVFCYMWCNIIFKIISLK